MNSKMFSDINEIFRLVKYMESKEKHTFRESADKYLKENQHKRSIDRDQQLINSLDPYIGNLFIDSINMQSLKGYIEGRRKDGVKTRTINMGLQVVRRILNLAATDWLNEYGVNWIFSAPKIKLMKENDKNPPYPISWHEQEALFSKLATHLKEMALFTVNSGCRSREVCLLRWEWEIYIKEIESSIFLIPEKFVKNGHNRVVILNDIAKAVIERQRGKNSIYVFVYRGRPIKKIMNKGWRNAREKVGLPHVRVHDLKHTFGCRLRAAGVSFEDRQDLLGHKSKKITTHYSAAMLRSLIASANKVCDRDIASTISLLSLTNKNFSDIRERFSNDFVESFA